MKKVTYIFILPFLLLVSGCIWTCSAVPEESLNHKKFSLIIDNDAHVDDFISALIQFRYAPERVIAITIAPADSYGNPGMWTMRHLRDQFLNNQAPIPLGLSTNEGTNPFPSAWRKDASKLVHLPMWGVEATEKNILDEAATPSSLEVLTQVLSESTTPVDILETGPCTNIAEVLNAHPELKDKIHRMYIMGGAVYVSGNVHEDEHDGSAEWNIYNNPEAFKQVLMSKIPITLIALDATQYTPIRKNFLNQMERNSHIKSFEFVCDSLKVIQPLVDSGQYMFWDSLTSAVAIDPTIVKTQKTKINVLTEGPSMGRTFEDEHGFEVDLAIWADQDKFEKILFSVLKEGPIDTTLIGK